MSKKEKIVLIGLVAILVGYAWYQIAFATNESSYMYGLEHSGGLFHCWAHPAFIGDDCGHNPSEPVNYCMHANDELTNQITNSTACADGFITGFVHWCSNDQNGCISLLKGGQTFNGTEYQQQALKDQSKS